MAQPSRFSSASLPRTLTTAATARAVLRSMRPRQWTKNLILFAPLLFSRHLYDLRAVVTVIGAFAVFCLLSGAVYIANDIVDVERDRLNEIKARRPIASGELGLRPAWAAASVLAAAALVSAWTLDVGFGLIATGYLVLQLAYMFALKDAVILDIMCIAGGFVARVAASAVAIDVLPSPWLLLCTALLASFLATVKRRHELLLDGHALEHRPVLQHYSPALLDQMISMVTAATIVMYSIYAFMSREAAEAPFLMLTIPFVAYGLLRYLYLMHEKHLGGSPEEVLLSDLPLVLDLSLWIGAVVLVLYL